MSRKTEFIIKWHSCFTNAFYFIRKRLYEGVWENAPLLKGSVLDFGCGAKPYRELFTNASSYTGLDIEKSGHSHQDEHIDVFYDGKIIPFGEEHFDHVFSTEVFEHVFNIDEVLPEIKRVLRKDGYLLITCPFVWPEHERPYDFARYTSFGIRHILEKHGFTIEKEIKTGHFFEVLAQQRIFYTFCLIPKKPAFLYPILHQLLILPQIISCSFLNFIAPNIIKRKDLFHNNIILARKN